MLTGLTYSSSYFFGTWYLPVQWTSLTFQWKLNWQLTRQLYIWPKFDTYSFWDLFKIPVPFVFMIKKVATQSCYRRVKMTWAIIILWTWKRIKIFAVLSKKSSMSGASRNFQKMDLNFDPSSHVADLNRAHLLYDDTKYNGNRHLQFSEHINYNQPCQEGSK